MNATTIVFLPGAELDLDEIVSWYEKQVMGLSEEFLEDLAKTITRIKRNPAYCYSLGEGIRKASLSRFPFFVIYTTWEKEVRIQTIIHQHRDPEEWQKRFK